MVLLSKRSLLVKSEQEADRISLQTSLESTLHLSSFDVFQMSFIHFKGICPILIHNKNLSKALEIFSTIRLLRFRHSWSHVGHPSYRLHRDTYEQNDSTVTSYQIDKSLSTMPRCKSHVKNAIEQIITRKILWNFSGATDVYLQSHLHRVLMLSKRFALAGWKKNTIH